MVICMTISSPDGPGLAVLWPAEGAEVAEVMAPVYVKVRSRGKQIASWVGTPEVAIIRHSRQSCCACDRPRLHLQRSQQFSMNPWSGTSIRGLTFIPE